MTHDNNPLQVHLKAVLKWCFSKIKNELISHTDVNDGINNHSRDPPDSCHSLKMCWWAHSQSSHSFLWWQCHSLYRCTHNSTTHWLWAEYLSDNKRSLPTLDSSQSRCEWASCCIQLATLFGRNPGCFGSAPTIQPDSGSSAVLWPCGHEATTTWLRTHWSELW